MLSKPLVYIATIFQGIGLVWDGYEHLIVSPDGKESMFAAPHWPIFLGFVVLLIAVLQSFPKKEKKPEDPNKNNPFLP